MTPEQQRIAIAKACGWRIVHKTKYAWVVICPSNIERAWSRRDGVMNDKPASFYLPDYLGDLNACHEMEKMLTAAQLTVYRNTLAMMNGGIFMDDGGSFVHLGFAVSATANQRADAFCDTLGLWKPTPTQPQ